VASTFICTAPVTALRVYYHVGLTTAKHVSVVSGTAYMRIKYLS